ncbi:threonine/serine dehydratase [Candidatus Gottesmanbacteria bacterium]|nr:threonine/serine dehydratase [Candidatus Gottesmanbacteria bacterium]
MDLKTMVLDADKRIRKYIRQTPLEFSFPLSRLTGAKVYLKLESEQITGSFKIRGAMNKLLMLTDEEKRRGVVTASAGNHGLAMTYGMQQLGIKGYIYLPKTAERAKVQTLKDYGARIKFFGNDMVNTEQFAREEALKTGMVYVSPYNDWQVVAGQGTIGVEIEKQLPGAEVVFVSIGGGGLVSGIAGYLKSVKPTVQVIGCQPENSPVMYASIQAGKIVQMKTKETLSDGTAGGIEPGAITFTICQQFVNRYILANEEEIKKAIYLILDRHHKLIEGAAALSVAALLQQKDLFKKKQIVLVLCGSDIGVEQLRKIL